MAKPLRAQLNQVRAWVRQGRTDAWIAHQLEVSTSELREFRRRHKLTADGEDATEADLRDEIEAEIAAAAEEEEEDEEEEEEEEEEGEEQVAKAEEPEEAEEPESKPEAGRAREPRKRPAETSGEGERPRRRRRRRRGGRKRAGANLQASFDHGEADGYGLWLDPAVADDPIYSEHWAGHRQVEVTVEPDQIVIRRSEG